MKAQRPHRVPLSGRAVEILSEARTLGGGGGLVFPSSEGRPLSGSTISTLLRGLRIAAVPHGFRSSFRDWCGECSNAPREVAEAALAHVVGSARLGSARLGSARLGSRHLAYHFPSLKSRLLNPIY